ncbi:TetR family transcriptional regulator [Amycolatopsis cynarae]|uniref:TetR family transcriptional regulator n=1 Tax=Amycolatopsis cynarae TaxID=2995223 RepID=A0ABY7B582_9PSEU|nr:TetR family transcriptional regulator [Amycolatopsis sp. HUAS 11-8]WAL66397.1 TetR family transcriptional regulator [Amycolatopsis sp. HUAS 11-8]
MLRELKKQRTRQAISDVATRLFVERGFDEVTIAQIAQAAGVAKMTVTNYFPRKEDLVFDVHEEFAGFLAGAVTGEEEALEASRRAYFAALSRRDALIGFSSADFARMIRTSPPLLARLRELHEERELALATVLAETRDEMTARIVAAQLTGVYRLLFEEVQRRAAEGQRPDTIAKAAGKYARRAFDVLAEGLA